MPRAIIAYPLIGCFVGYAGASLAGVEDSLTIFGVSMLTMVAVTVAGFRYSRRSDR